MQSNNETEFYSKKKCEDALQKLKIFLDEKSNNKNKKINLIKLVIFECNKPYKFS